MAKVCNLMIDHTKLSIKNYPRILYPGREKDDIRFLKKIGEIKELLDLEDRNTLDMYAGGLIWGALIMSYELGTDLSQVRRMVTNILNTQEKMKRKNEARR